MKKCIMYTNCQGNIGIKPLLESHPEFSSTYKISHFSNYEKEPIPDTECDLYIFQHNKTPQDHIKYTKAISFPYLYDDGTFPVHHGTGGFKIIDELLEKGLDPVKMYDNGEIDFKLDERKKKSLEILKEKEQRCTIKISDFLESAQGSRVPLFFTHNHPTMFVTVELTNRLLAHLGMNEMHPMIKCIGWLGGTHLDATGFCHYPGNKEKSTSMKSILPLDKYSERNQKKIFNFQTNQWEDFYIMDDNIVRGKITDYLDNYSR